MDITTTACESPWQNGLYDQHKLPLDIALAYDVNAKNSLQMWKGFSSHQLVFGENPQIPSLMIATPPQLEGTTTSETVDMHLNALHNARKSFIESENCEKIVRALHSTIRSKLEKHVPGD